MEIPKNYPSSKGSSRIEFPLHKTLQRISMQFVFQLLSRAFPEWLRLRGANALKMPDHFTMDGPENAETIGDGAELGRMHGRMESRTVCLESGMKNYAQIFGIALR
jgi:hypothetical protein